MLEHLNGREDALAEAAELLDPLLRRADDFAPEFALVLFSDAARVFDAELRRTQDDELLRRVIACCDVVIQLRRDHDVHPPSMLINLDPRLQSMVALCAARLGARFARGGDPDDRERAIDLARAAVNLTAPCAGPRTAARRLRAGARLPR